MNDKSKTPLAGGASELMGNKFDRHDRQLLGCCLIRPDLVKCIPPIVSNRFSPFSIYVMNLMQSGAGIEAVTKSLEASGVEDAEAIVADAIRSVKGDATKTFWRVVQRLCDEVLP